MTRWRRFTWLLRVSGLLLALLPLTGCYAQAASGPTTPIEHFVVLMQEGHSFDNYFGTYPGAEGLNADTCMRNSPGNSQNTSCVKPFHLQQNATVDLSHNATAFRRQYRGGGMNGFVAAQRAAGKDGALAMGYYNGDDLPFYWNLADEYVLFDHFFSSAAGGSIRNNMYWVTGTPGGERDQIPAQGWGDTPTIFDRLQASGISWKFYVQNYNPKITYRNQDANGQSAQVTRVPLLAYARYLDDPRLAGRIVDLNEYFKDLQAGTLPAVAYIATAAASEHPPSNIQAGPRLARTLLNELMRSSAWPSSAFLITYSNWGGWYDHVEPPRVDDQGYGFRVPALLVSPYARKGHIESTVLDHTSILKFIEGNYRLPPLAQRDAKANSLITAFDFGQPPRNAEFVPAERATAPQGEPRRVAIYVTYGAALILPGLIIALAVSNGRRAKPRFPAGPSLQEDSAT